MISERVVDELASRCLALIVFDQHDRSDRSSVPEMRAELRAIASEVEQGGFPPAVFVEKVFSGLLYRYEPGRARRLHQEVFAAFSIKIEPTGAVVPRRGDDPGSRSRLDSQIGIAPPRNR